MTSICLYFQIHQPYRLRNYSFFDIGESPYYENENLNCDTILKMARNCYLPANNAIFDAIRKHKGKFKVTFSISGTALDMFEIHAPEVIESFQSLAQTGCVEFLSETYAHSLAFLHSKQEFKEQVQSHAERIKELFNLTPTAFRNTELIYNNELAKFVEEMGYKAVLAEGADHVLAWRSSNHVYTPKSCDKIKLLMKNYALSDDISIRFSQRDWAAYPLTADKYALWLRGCKNEAEVINLFMNYEAFGGFHSADSGIFQFLEALPTEILKNENFDFKTVTEAAEAITSTGIVDVPNLMSWTDAERDLTAWLGNDMQLDSLNSIYKLEPLLKSIKNPHLLASWRRLQASDHLHAMSTKWISLAAAAPYSTVYPSPYDAYINYMNVLADIELRAKNEYNIQQHTQNTVKTNQAKPKTEKKEVAEKIKNTESKTKVTKKTEEKTEKPSTPKKSTSGALKNKSATKV